MGAADHIFNRSMTPRCVTLASGNPPMEPRDIRIEHNAAAGRFEARIDGWLCRCDYRLIDGVVHLMHTEVPPSLEGKGIAAALVRAALGWAAEQKLKVRPRCSYVRAYMQRHPETLALRAD
jgi:uncharacterized protein